jgi:hypothetical protein
MLVQSASCPWNVPVPVEPGRFVSVVPEHQPLNVQVARGRSYGVDSAQQQPESLLYADLQTNLYSNAVGRLGSGRSGFFRGWYLKGVGRTPLAANWNGDDKLHSSGHQTASSAIREYVVSRYLQSQDGASTVVACEGILLAELEPALADYQRIVYGDKPADVVPEVDNHVQAITIKSGAFARHSNFTWLLHHLSPCYVDRGRSSLGEFCELLTAALTLPGEQVPAAVDVTTTGLVHLLARGVRRACEHFRTWFTKGVWWGSFHNNFTIDGRFLDLEVPALLGGPCFGCLSSSENDSEPAGDLRSSLFGSELFFYLAHTRAFCSTLRLLLGNLPNWFSVVEREFAAELASEIEGRLLGPNELLGSRGQAIDLVRGLLDDVFGRLPPADQAMVDRVVEYLHDQELGPGPEFMAEQPELRLAAVPGCPRLLTEPGARWRPFAVALSSGRRLEPSEAQRRACRHLAELISDLDHTTSLPALLDKLTLLSKSSHVV